ncbi:hypothetical protein C8F01DRAFT_1243129 [Mycena amicta]|nr:hypothetical protein C8F01DRAFT_1243129 [Mycena amicta]
MAVVQFTVNNTSPAFTYFPRGDTFSAPNLSAGWNPHWDVPGFSSANIGATGSGSSSQITARDGASFQLQWKGTGIELFGNLTRSTYSITLDGRPQNTSASASDILFNIQDLSDKTHTLTLAVHTTSQDALVQFNSAVISAPPSPSNLSITNFTEIVLNDSAWSYKGHWSFSNDSDSAQRSTTAGDKAALQFKGTALLLRGSTSPDGGSYSVTLDNVSTTYSARSSFTQADSLLFFASGLDADTVHHLEINNTQGATLVLPVRGATVFALPEDSGNGASGASAAASNPSGTSQGGLSSGTIAALVLAGVLIFFIVVCVLVYFLLYRPYKRRQRLLHQSPKEDQFQDVDAGSVLVVDIAPDAIGAKAFYDHAEFAGPSRDRTSRRSGFARWKDEVEGGRLGSWGRGALGIAFRHSDSSGRKGTSASSNEYELGAATDGYKSTSSSSNAGYTDRRKGKGRESGGRWPLRNRREKSLSPQFKVHFPIESPPPASGSQQPAGVPQEPSVISSLSYLSSPSLHPGTIPSEPPSPAHRPAPFPNTHSRANSNNVLLVHDIPQPSEPVQARRPTPPSQILMPPPSDPPRQDDTGSVRDYDAADDGRSIIGDGAVRIALRSLSPRTSENEKSPKQRSGKRRAKEKRSKEAGKAEDTFAADTLFLRTTSPFQVDFLGPTGARLSGQSRVRFEGDSGSASDPGKRKAEADKSLKAPVPSSSNHLRDTSFLDFTSSSEGSMMTRSRDFSLSERSVGSFGPQSNWSIGGSSGNMASVPPPAQTKSRWSATTAPSSEAHQEVSNGSSDSSNFPFPVSLPASPHHPAGTFFPPPPLPMQMTDLGVPGGPDSSLSSLNAHPTDLGNNPSSPTDSYPMSVSDINFRHSSSEEPSSRQSGIPSHPPLPSPAAPPEEASYIVQRVVGVTTPSPSIGTTMLATPTPTATRFNTSGTSRSSPGSGREL